MKDGLFWSGIRLEASATLHNRRLFLVTLLDLINTDRAVKLGNHIEILFSKLIYNACFLKRSGFAETSHWQRSSDGSP
jgi:hypothetical protein